MGLLHTLRREAWGFFRELRRWWLIRIKGYHTVKVPHSMRAYVPRTRIPR